MNFIATYIFEKNIEKMCIYVTNSINLYKIRLKAFLHRQRHGMYTNLCVETP